MLWATQHCRRPSSRRPKGPFTAETAAKVKDKVKEWANDPEVQAKARHYAGMAMAYAGRAGALVAGVIEQGPAGIRIIAFCTSLASVALFIFFFIDIKNALGCIKYAVAVHQAVLALTTMLFEAKPEWIAKVLGLDGSQNKLIEYWRVIAIIGGRGLFYLFQGCKSLMAVKDLTGIFGLVVGSLQATAVATAFAAARAPLGGVRMAVADDPGRQRF